MYIDVSETIKQYCSRSWQKKKKKKQKCSQTNVFYRNSIYKKTLLQWFDTKIKSQNLEIDRRIKNQFERKNPINQQNNKCVGCNCLLKVDPLSRHVLNYSMSEGDFFIRYERKFLRNIVTKKLLNRLKLVLLKKI